MKLQLRETLPELAAPSKCVPTQFSRASALAARQPKKGPSCTLALGEHDADSLRSCRESAAGPSRQQVAAALPTRDVHRLYPTPNPSHHSSEIRAFTEPHDAPAEYPPYRGASPVAAVLEEGEMLYLPAFWYHAVAGGEAFNVISCGDCDTSQQVRRRRRQHGCLQGKRQRHEETFRCTLGCVDRFYYVP